MLTRFYMCLQMLRFEQKNGLHRSDKNILLYPQRLIA